MRTSKLFIIILLIFQITGCATHQNKDPLENFNRAVYKFNDVADNAIIKPVSKGYRNVAPKFVVRGINNFFNNIRDVITIINELLQGKVEYAANDTGRVLVNSTIGLLGFVDVHSISGGERRKEDFGQTMGVWGAGSGCYFVLPILGPTTARDAFGMLADSFIDPFAHVTIREHELLGASGNSIDYFTVKGTTAVDFRAANDLNFENLEKNSLDLYSSFKSIYLQDRENKIKNSTDDQDDWGNLDN